MEISSALSELEMEESAFIYQHQMKMNPHDSMLDELSFLTDFSAENHHQTPAVNASPFTQTPPSSVAKRPQEKSGQLASVTSASSSSRIISFENSDSRRANSEKVKTEMCFAGNQDFSFLMSQSLYENQNQSAGHGREIKRPDTMSRAPAHAQEHVIAERRRRERLSQRFIALSALIPGLKKTDKASVLEDAINHVKELQERLKWAEEEISKRVMESVAVYVKKKTHLSTDDETSSSDRNCNSSPVRQVPAEIEARVSDRDVLLRIHCEKHKGCLSNVLNEIEKLKLRVASSCVLPFGHSRVDITIVAQMEVDFCMTTADLVTKLRQFAKFMC